MKQLARAIATNLSGYKFDSINLPCRTKHQIQNEIRNKRFTQILHVPWKI